MNNQLRESLVANDGPLSGESIQSLEPVSGGCIHRCWRLRMDNERSFFAKVCHRSRLPMLEAEKQGLMALQQWANPEELVVPNVLGLSKLGSNAVLLLPWLDLGAGDQRCLGSGLASMHQSSASNHDGRFGWPLEGFIGSGVQPKGWRESWGEAFVELRLRPQMQVAKQWGLLIEEFETLLMELRIYLDQHQPVASLVHGDLWSGNASVLPDLRGVLIDPAAWWADREVDLAMTKLFGGFSGSFYAEYGKIWPLSEDYEFRIDIYNLYHLLNHANLFGGSYKQQTLNRLNSLARTMNG